MAEDTVVAVPAAVVVPTDKTPRAKAAVSVVTVGNLQKTETLIAVAGREPYGDALDPFGVTAAFLSTLTADLARCRSLFGLAVDDTALRPSQTRTEAEAKDALIVLIQKAQSAALIETAGRPAPGWYIGTELSVASRGMLEQVAVALAGKLDAHVPKGLPEGAAAQLRAALAALQTADATQGATLTTAKQKRAAANALYATIQDRRFQILLAADAAYPSRKKANAAIRADFGIPKTRPYRPKRTAR